MISKNMLDGWYTKGQREKRKVGKRIDKARAGVRRRANARKAKKSFF